MNLRALQGLDRDLQQSLLSQIRDLWTHASTALEGNTLRGCIRTNLLIIISLFPEMVSFNPRPASPYT
jgi:hypothetical protein